MSATGEEVIRSEVDARILVVDDEPEIATLVADSLRQADPSWHVVAETDAGRALARLNEEAFDCLVTDLVMPTMDGLALAKEARSLDDHLGLIAITGRGTLQNSIEALRLGFADFLAKPFDLSAVERAVCRTLRRQRQQETFETRFAELAEANTRLETDQAQLDQKLQIASHDLVLSNRRLARQVEDLAATADVAKSLMGVIELEDLLGLGAELLGDRIACQTSTLALYETQEAAIGLMVRARPESDDPPALCWLCSPIRQGVLCRAAQGSKTVHINDIASSALVGDQEKELWPEGRILVVPIPYQGQPVAVAVLHRSADSEDFTAADVKTAAELAKVMAPAILTAKLHHRQRCQIYGTLEAVADAMENRDPYLKGHSARVLAYAQQIATALELSQPQMGALQIAARLHDIGRIALPESAVNHLEPLTEEQRDIVQQHPAAGAEFLKPLEFLGEVGDIIRAHHESYDGTGYPDRKAGNEIPMVARILTVADTFDAMTSLRPHRQPLSLEEAKSHIRRVSGEQFDPQVVEAFLSLSDDVLEEIRDSRR